MLHETVKLPPHHTHSALALTKKNLNSVIQSMCGDKLNCSCLKQSATLSKLIVLFGVECGFSWEGSGGKWRKVFWSC